MALTQRPPLVTLLREIVGWTLDRTSAIPKGQRFTFGLRLDGGTLDALQLATRLRHPLLHSEWRRGPGRGGAPHSPDSTDGRGTPLPVRASRGEGAGAVGVSLRPGARRSRRFIVRTSHRV